MRSSVKTALILLPVLLAATAAAGTTFVRVRADLAQQRAAINTEWTEVDEALQERAELVENLVNAGQKLAPIGSDVMTQVTEARKAVTGGPGPDDKIQAHLRLSNALAKVLLEAENHPNLRNDDAFLRLQEEIRNSDDRIAEARLRYNDSLEHYNARIQSFPQNLVARISGFRRNDAYFPTEHF
ncbi:MAG TPA: LemA family protein [Bryobacteraceae bacterium]|nr:LemA family protein [Bryobacteraceae bacterium]